MDRRTFVGAGVAGFALPQIAFAAGEPLEIISADVRPLSIADGPRRGIVLDIMSEACERIGRTAQFTFLPFSEALQRTQATAGALMTPLARSPQREALFSWVVKLLDVPQAMGTLTSRPRADLASGRQLGKVGVVAAGVQEGYLKEQGYTNLVSMPTARDLATALAEGKIDAWYATATEVVVQFELIGQAGKAHLGPAIQTVPVWLAGNKHLDGSPAAALSEAIGELHATGGINRHYEKYVR
jgi:polar amino acid transport system substrate-binding protein